jgi:hypothetical protein
MQGILPIDVRLVAAFSLFLIASMMLGAGLAMAGQLSHFPSPNQPWTTREYVDFYFGHYNGNRALPHLRSEETARLFGRIVNRENVLRITEGSTSPEQKRVRIAMILATMGEIRAAYGYAVFVGEPLQEELMRVQSFMLFLIDVAVRLENRAGPAAAGKQAWKTTLWNVVGSLSERDTYSGLQIASLSSALHVHYPQISVILSDPDKQKFRARIGEAAAAETDAAARKAHLQLLYTALKY